MRRFLLAGLFGLATSPALATEVVILESAKDNTLYESETGALSNGSGPQLFAGRTNQAQNNRRRGLVQFDLTSIPSGSSILRTILVLDLTRTNSGDQTVAVHPALSDWGEGSSVAPGRGGEGAPAEPGDATWVHTFFDTDSWTNEGGDFGPMSAMQTVGDVGTYFWSSAQLLQDVAGWVDDPRSNFGWVLIGDESVANTAKRFGARENGNPDRRPRLFVEYCTSADSSSYGTGLAGAAGVPTVDTSALPILGSNITIDLSNGTGANTVGALVVGSSSQNVPGPWGGDLLVVPVIVQPIPVPPGGLSIPFSVPAGDEFCDFELYLQWLLMDDGAPQGIASSEGRQLTFGS